MDIIAMALVFCGVLSAGNHRSTIARDRVDLIELNHAYDDSGRHVFDQVLFYRWSPHHRMFQVTAWRLVKKTQQLPVQSLATGGYTCRWTDDGVLREIWAPSFRETWSSKDPERENRKIFAEAQRNELAKAPAQIDRPALR